MMYMDYLPPRPACSGSYGQVYRATLASNAVAVKVGGHADKRCTWLLCAAGLLGCHIISCRLTRNRVWLAGACCHPTVMMLIPRTLHAWI